MRAHGDKVTPERKFLTMETPFMKAYVQLLIKTCHRRGAFAMGGMAAQIPVKNNPKLAAQALESVKTDKVPSIRKEATLGTGEVRACRLQRVLSAQAFHGFISTALYLKSSMYSMRNDVERFFSHDVGTHDLIAPWSIALLTVERPGTNVERCSGLHYVSQQVGCCDALAYS